MRVGEQLRFDETAKLSVSAPRPSSVACGDSFPEGKLWGPLQIGTAAKGRRDRLQIRAFRGRISLNPTKIEVCHDLHCDYQSVH